MLAVWDGEMRALPKLHEFYNLGFFKTDEILAWLVKNRYTGKKFMGLIDGDFNGSLVETTSYILMKLQKNKEQNPVIFGKDLR